MIINNNSSMTIKMSTEQKNARTIALRMVSKERKILINDMSNSLMNRSMKEDRCIKNMMMRIY